MEPLIKLFADFNNTDKEGRVRLITFGLLHDLKAKNVTLTPGLKALFDDNDELKAIGVVEFSTSENIWVARIDWETPV